MAKQNEFTCENCGAESKTPICDKCQKKKQNRSPKKEEPKKRSSIVDLMNGKGNPPGGVG